MAYRDDLGALRARLRGLDEEVAALAARKRELDSTCARLDAATAELADVRARVERARRLPLLDGVRIASPCPARWEDMRGDERVRLCTACGKNVYNVIALCREEAEDILRAHEGEVCMRLYRRGDGTILTADCPVGRPKRRRRQLLAGALLTAGAGVTGAFAAGDATVGELFGEERGHGGTAHERQVAPPELSPRDEGCGLHVEPTHPDDRPPYPAVIGSAAPTAEPAPEPRDASARPGATHASASRPPPPR